MDWVYIKVVASAVCLIAAGTAYAVAEYDNGAAFWKWVASVALSVCGVLAMLLYQDLRRMLQEAKRERDEFRRKLDRLP